MLTFNGFILLNKNRKYQRKGAIAWDNQSAEGAEGLGIKRTGD